MEAPGLLSRLLEKSLSWVPPALILAAGVAVWQMDPAARAAIWAGIWKSAAWLAFSAAWPWVTQLFVGRVLAAGSNWAAAALLATLILGNVLLGLALLGGLPAGGWGWAAALAALGAAGFYNYLVAEYVAQRHGG